MPISYSRGLSGNSAVLLGGNEDAGSYAVRALPSTCSRSIGLI
jgi:hypothetical protein